jgi:hypothetical protein
MQFVFGFDAIPKLVEMAKNLDKTAWEQLHRKQRTSEQLRARRLNTKEQVVIEKEYKNKRLEKEFVAEIAYSPSECDQTYRMIVLHKEVSVTKGQRKLIDDSPFFFYITNVSSTEKSAEEIVLAVNKRCDHDQDRQTPRQYSSDSPVTDDRCLKGTMPLIQQQAIFAMTCHQNVNKTVVIDVTRNTGM